MRQQDHEVAVKEVSMLYCEKCGANYNQEYHHRCDEWDIACMGKQVCIDLPSPPFIPLKEVRAIPEGGYCKHLTPEYWEKKGYERDGVMLRCVISPELEILLKEK